MLFEVGFTELLKLGEAAVWDAGTSGEIGTAQSFSPLKDVLKMMKK